MNPDHSSAFEQREFRRRILRWILLALALVLSGAGYMALAVSPDAPMEVVIARVFWGIGLLFAGFFAAMLSRLLL
ncbi:MAG: hypothetical protein ABIJ50_06580 [Pseudomonadota bacterium]